MRRLLLLLLLATGLHAQIVTSALTGRVSAGDAPAEGVTVTATSRDRNHTRTTTTGPRGTYFFEALEPGVYDVTFSRAGHSSLTRPATVELGRVARADATIEASADEESVTSTAESLSVAETTLITTHFPDRALDRMPIHRDPESAASIAPDPHSNSGTFVDGGLLFSPALLGEELTEEVTTFRGNAPVDAEPLFGNAIAARTRSGANGFFLSIRDTVEKRPKVDAEHVFETASSGRIVPDRLWFFAAGWSGNRPRLDGVAGFEVKLSAHVTNAHALEATHIDGELDAGLFRFETRMTALRYTGILGERTTAEAFAARSETALSAEDQVRGRLSHLVATRGGDHLLSAGIGRAFDATTLFINDRWSAGRLVVDAGLRHSTADYGSNTAPRLAMTFDVRGNGRQAIAASYGEYGLSDDGPYTRVASVGFISALGTTGTSRIDAIRREGDLGDIDQLAIDTRYRLFDRFEFGTNYTWSGDDSTLPPFHADHVANAWVGLEVPIGDHELGTTILQRWIDDEHRPRVSPTDLALRYAIPFPRFGLQLAADVANIFESDETSLAGPRVYRFWARIRFSGSVSPGN